MAIGLDLGVARENATNVSELPDLHALERVEDKALWALAFAKDKMGTSYLSSAEISTMLSDVFEMSTDVPAIRMALSRGGKLVHTKNFGSVRKFSIMKAGRKQLAGAASRAAIIIDPQKPHQGILQISDLLGGLSGLIRVCDPYLDRKTLEITPMMPDRCEIRFLSNHPKDGPEFARHLKAYKVEHPNLQIRTMPPGRIHDRYLITDHELWSIGHSLNAIGSKQTIIARLGEEIRTEMERAFECLWNNATVLG